MAQRQQTVVTMGDSPEGNQAIVESDRKCIWTMIDVVWCAEVQIRQLSPVESLSTIGLNILALEAVIRGNRCDSTEANDENVEVWQGQAIQNK
jgi:hypothetical protein